MTPDRTARLAVFLSGSGRTLSNLFKTIGRGELDAEVVLGVASRECRGAEIGREAGVPTEVIPGRISEQVLIELAERYQIDWVVLAGYLQLLPIPDRLAGRVVNIHPAVLLPAFGGPGMHGRRVHEAAIEAFARGEITESGCTVHLCDARYDTGPIVHQLRCPIEPGDTLDSLAARVFELELQAYPEAIKMLISGNGPGPSDERA